eukprot:363897-Chlamydomonas_euryale.AAC.9
MAGACSPPRYMSDDGRATLNVEQQRVSSAISCSLYGKQWPACWATCQAMAVEQRDVSSHGGWTVLHRATAGEPRHMSSDGSM